jgi:hypothetical protein
VNLGQGASCAVLGRHFVSASGSRLPLSEAENIVQDGVIKRKTFRALDIEA